MILLKTESRKKEHKIKYMVSSREHEYRPSFFQKEIWTPSIDLRIHQSRLSNSRSMKIRPVLKGLAELFPYGLDKIPSNFAQLFFWCVNSFD
jgi:hypothetical protein